MARYLIDANLPRYISYWNSDDYVFATDLGERATDQELWDYAFKHDLTIVTKDADFTDRVLVSSVGPSVIHFRVGNMRLRQFHEFLQRNWSELCRMSSEFRLVIVFDDRVECVS